MRGMHPTLRHSVAHRQLPHDQRDLLLQTAIPVNKPTRDGGSTSDHEGREEEHRSPAPTSPNTGLLRSVLRAYLSLL